MYIRLAKKLAMKMVSNKAGAEYRMGVMIEIMNYSKLAGLKVLQ